MNRKNVKETVKYKFTVPYSVTLSLKNQGHFMKNKLLNSHNPNTIVSVCMKYAYQPTSFWMSCESIKAYWSFKAKTCKVKRPNGKEKFMVWTSTDYMGPCIKGP